MHGIYDDEKWIGYKNNRLTVIGVERKKGQKREGAYFLEGCLRLRNRKNRKPTIRYTGKNEVMRML